MTKPSVPVALDDSALQEVVGGAAQTVPTSPPETEGLVYADDGNSSGQTPPCGGPDEEFVPEYAYV